MTLPIAPSGIFWTVQGEGALSGEPMAFVRLAGCSVGCADCDTDYRVDKRLDVAELVKAVQAVVPAGFNWPWAWITGGEPTDHDIAPLVDLLQTVGFRVALATAGVKDVSRTKLQWISVSAHSLAVVQRSGHELKVVPGLNGLSWRDIEEIDSWKGAFAYRYVQPLAGGSNLAACIAFVKTHPGWRLSGQAHKIWGVA